MPSAITYDWFSSFEVEAAHEIESEGFPPEEAASLETLKYRQQHAPELFLGAYTWLPPSPRRLVGYCCSTLIASPTLTHESMSTHDASGKNVALHSICLAKSVQGQGLSKALLQEYITRLRTSKKYDNLLLLSHEGLVSGLYEKVGLKSRGKSDVQHGPDPWFEMSIPLKEERRNPGESWQDLNVQEMTDAQGKNKYDLFCPRSQCRCLLLRKGNAILVKRDQSPLDDPKAKPTPVLPDFPPTPDAQDQHCWSVHPPSPLTFDNVGFSKTLGTLKYLTCADCDCGPLGFVDAKGRDLGMEVEQERLGEKDEKPKEELSYLLSCRRVRYKIV